MGKIREFLGLEKRANYSDTITDLLVRTLQGNDLLNAVSGSRSVRPEYRKPVLHVRHDNR